MVVHANLQQKSLFTFYNSTARKWNHFSPCFWLYSLVKILFYLNFTFNGPTSSSPGTLKRCFRANGEKNIISYSNFFIYRALRFQKDTFFFPSFSILLLFFWTFPCALHVLSSTLDNIFIFHFSSEEINLQQQIAEFPER